jgi:hypothetical protein
VLNPVFQEVQNLKMTFIMEINLVVRMRILKYVKNFQGLDHTVGLLVDPIVEHHWEDQVVAHPWEDREVVHQVVDHRVAQL